MTHSIDLIAGARPNFMKIAALVRALEARRLTGGQLRYRLVHTGQHYDTRMSGDFFEQLNLPQPHVNLGAGSGSQAEQAAAIMIGYERLLCQAPSDLCVVVGDVTSTMACAITAQKLGVQVAHVEGGIRSGDWGMPEEINRLVTDSITNWFFTTSEYANQNLRSSGISDNRIFFVGNTMIDTLLANLGRARPPGFADDMKLGPQNYIVVTLHRPSNVDNSEKLMSILSRISKEARGVPLVFPVHPRTQRSLESLDDLPSELRLVAPQPYLEFIWLIKNAKAVVTDSGGITEETTVMGVPCLTLRNTTERPETVSVGTNELIGDNPDKLSFFMERLFAGRWKEGAVPPQWDGLAGERIISHLEALLQSSR